MDLGKWFRFIMAISFVVSFSAQGKGLDRLVLHGFNTPNVEVSEHLGKRPIYIKFWASWCAPCMAQMPHLQALYEKHHQEITFLIVNIDLNETDAAIEKVVNQFGLTFPLYQDVDGQAAKALPFVGTPYHVLIDANGNVVHRGHDATKELDQKLAILAALEGDSLPIVELDQYRLEPTFLDIKEAGTYVLLFTATWCDWYLKDRRPDMAKQCEATQKWFHEKAQAQKGLHFKVVVNHLWTTEHEVETYKKKYGHDIPVLIDVNGEAFSSFGVRDMPVIAVVKGGKVVYQGSDLNSIYKNFFKR